MFSYCVRKAQSVLDHRIYFGVSFSDYRVILLPLEAASIRLVPGVTQLNSQLLNRFFSPYKVRYRPDYQKQRV